LGERNAQFVKDKAISQPRPLVSTGDQAVKSTGIDFPLYVTPKKMAKQEINKVAALPFETEREVMANNIAKTSQPEYIMKSSSYDGVKPPLADIIPTAGATETFTPNVGR